MNAGMTGEVVVEHVVGLLSLTDGHSLNSAVALFILDRASVRHPTQSRCSLNACMNPDE